ncbi:MAG: hypothetical protein IKE42_16500 [Aquamicrobium sp.]|uniref:hypothetical protein n=1 Tax=Mesorhizobium sp. Pch-S TaxID=2082387 RepID=UPI0013EBC808|nr:hypothetical protein [Mesorhizobium sp. Pch-S]MBR2689451.1 hypothetical protein [Aquamicrobium sp.]
MRHGQLVDEFGIGFDDVDGYRAGGFIGCHATFQRAALGVGEAFVGADDASIERA